MNITYDIEQNINLIKTVFKGDPGVIYREFYISNINSIKCYIIYIEYMTNTEKINDYIIKPVMKITDTEFCGQTNTSWIFNNIIASGGGRKTSNIDDIVCGVLEGKAVFLLENSSEALIADVIGWEKRAVSTAETEKVVRGPKEAFTESIMTNITMIRRKVKSTNLKFEFMEIGEITKTKVCVCYLEGITSPEILKEAIQRLNNIKIDGVLESGYLEESIRDSKLSPFKTIGNTERPDVLVGKLLEGKAAILCDGTPIALTAPFVFLEYFKFIEDYYNGFYYASINRIVRFIGFFLTTSVPAIYIALITFHQEMLPTQLLISIVAARKGIPFPTVIEALMMLFLFEILREAGLRIPTPVGQTVSIVGALVIGQAAVEAKLTSAPMVIIAAVTGISSFLTPKFDGEVIIIRIFFILLSSFIGLYGYIFGFICVFIYLSSITSFGAPYMVSIKSVNSEGKKDTLIRFPWAFMKSGHK